MANRTRTAPAEPAPTPATKRSGWELFLISIVILFLELACIRWFPANVLYLTFFTNMVLLASFLGMSLGCLAAGHKRNYLKFTPLILVLAMASAWEVGRLRDQMEQIVQVGNSESPQQIYFGTEYKHSDDPSKFYIPIEAVEGIFFFLIALTMVGPGQQLGRSLAKMPNRVRAYTINIAGSVVGILLFSLCSWLQLSPAWWFLLLALGLGYFLMSPIDIWSVVGGSLFTVAILLSIATRLTLAEGHEQYWSPYYRVDYDHQTSSIVVNLIGHQSMVSRNAIYPTYSVPYLLMRDSGIKTPENVMIIGAGSGNDVSRALLWGAGHIDAVEIDPVIRWLGEQHHPDQPYSETNRVTAWQADGRNFLRRGNQKYNLIIYALVDSLVLHSGYSNIRLESYLFTKEAFEDVKRRLEPNGLFVMYNFFRQGWLVARLQKTLAEVFGEEPLVIMFPPVDEVQPDLNWRGFTLFVAGSPEALQPLKAAYAKMDPNQMEAYWIDTRRFVENSPTNGFVEHPTRDTMQYWWPVALSKVIQPTDDLPVATDDWPFLYLRRPMVPDLSLRGAAIMGAIALLMLGWFVPPRPRDIAPKWWREMALVWNYWTIWGKDARPWTFDGRMFYLGAGFMLVETKAVVHMALVFGSTWMVNSVVFLAVLVMILLANLFVLKFRPTRLGFYYAGLAAALLLNVAVPLNFFLGWPAALQMLASCLLVFAPVLFSGVIFAVSFSRTAEADRAFGFNIAGAMLGGLVEYTSMLLGFRYLLLVALAFYVLSALWRSTPLSKSTPIEEMKPAGA